MNRDEAHLRDRLLMLAESTAPHIPFNVKRKSSQKPGSGRNGPKLSVQDVVRMDPGYTPDIQHLVFPAKKRSNPQQVAAAPVNTNSSGKTRSRLAEMFALSRHLQQRSVDRDVKPRTSMLNRSVDGSLEPRHTAPRSAAAADISQRWIVEEPVRQNTSTRVSPAKETDMATTRGPNVSVLHLRGPSDPWDTSPTAAVFTTNSTRSYSSSRSSYTPLTKHQSLGGYNKNYNQYNPNSNTNSSEIYLGGTCSRELSPVRWCDQEVDGVYLGRSGWVQVHQRSFDENRRGHYATSDSLQPSRRIGIKLADYHCKSEPGPPEETKEVQRPAYLPLRSRDYDIPKAKTPSPMRVPENFSPPSVTPIISPPPAFQDRNQKMKTRTFFGKPPFLPRSNAIVDSDVSPPLSPKTWSAPRKPKTSPIVEHVRSYPRIPQTKSLEDTTATRRTQFVQKYGESSSSSSSSMGFRSLDSYVPRVAMPRLSENTDSSLDVYEDADDEDNNSSSINMSIVNVEVHQTREVHQSRTTKDKVSPSNRQPRTPYRAQRRSPGNSDTNRQSGCNSPTSSTSSSGNEFPSPNVQVRRSAPARQYQTPEEQSIRVRRSRSLQLPEKKPTVGYRNPSVKISPQPDSHRVVVKIGGSKRNEEVLSEDMLKEAEVVTGFLYGSRSKAAAQALLMQRYNNVREEVAASQDPPKPNNGYNVYIVNKKEKKLQRGLTAPAPSKKPTPVEVKPQYPGDACDFWPHCTHRILTSANSNQSMMKISHSYPTHQRSLDHSSPEVPQRVHPKSEPQKRLSRADTEIKYTNVMTTSSSRFGDNMRRLSPNKSACERRSSPVNRGVSPQSRNPSSSSTSSDVYLTTSSRSPKNAKSSGASTPMEEVPEREKAVREIVLTRPGSAPSDENKPGFVDAQQRSMSLPKSFLSGTYQQACQIPWRKKGADSLTTSPGLNRRTIASKAQTAPVTPLHDSNRRRSPLGGASARKAKANSSPQLLDPLHTDHSKWENDRPENAAEIHHRINPKDFSRGRSLPGPTTESVLQKFRKTFSLRFQKKGSKECCSTDLGDNLAEIPADHGHEDSVLHLQSVSPCNTLAEAKDDHSEQKYKFGPLVWRSSKERKKLNKAARNAKCNSGDSGIQIEMAPNCGDRTGGDSSESHDTDQPCDDLDSPPVRRRASGHHPANGRAARPHSDLINQILIDKFKAELKSRAHRRPCVRRTHSDLGGQRILHWEARSSYRRLMASPAAIKGRPQSPRKRPPDLPGAVQLRTNSHRRGQLRRSLSQPLDIDKLSPLMKLKATGFRNGGSTVVSEDEHDRGTSDDDMMSDSESSVASLSDRKKSLELAMDEEMVILAEAVFDHVAIEAEELAFRAGDVIEVQTTSNRDWWWGGCDGRNGWFPAAFVRLRVSQEDTVEDCLAAMASGRSVPSQLRRRTSVSLLSNDQVRTSVVRELVHTERDFVKVLQDVVEGYIAECRKRSDMFSDEQINAIFINLEEILKFQTGFLKDLESSIDWDFPHKSCVGSCFMKHKEGFTMYSDYCNSHPIATATLQELYRFNSYSKFFEACRLMRGLIEIPLDGYLLTPVQRICKYPLQLAELLKYTKVEHADYAHIREALEAMRGVAVLINERKRRMESLEKLAAWQQRVEGWEGEDLIEKSSQLIHQGEIIRVTTGVWTSNLTLFLFDHQLVYCKKDILKRNTYVYKGRIHLDTTEVIDVPDGKDTHIGVTVRHAIRLYSVIRDKWLLFCCRSASEKKRWLEAFAEERSHVARDKSDGIEFPSAAKQLARVASRCQRRPPRKPGGGKHYKMESPYIGSMLQLNSQNSNSLGRKVGTWFTFGGNKKTRHQQRDVS